ncbi:MAG: zinc ribbon-containing protein [Gammaproteobacteria bacterium]|nr:zinc ribbon-containing protein [Gammaproteobacteria bacterium]MBU1416697.1 zinc ribbon-containing protein [Gammaproteobacteria bacterium]
MNPNEDDRNPDSQNVAEEGPQTAGDTPEEKERSRYEALYDQFSERVRELYEAGQEKGKEALDKAMEMAREQYSAAGKFSAEQGEAFKKYFRRDLEQAEQEMHTLGHEARERLNPSRLGAGALSSVARLLESAGTALLSLSQKAENALHFKTGEITTAGTLTCTKCGQTVQLKQTAHIPPCPRCNATEFRKGY